MAGIRRQNSHGKKKMGPGEEEDIEEARKVAGKLGIDFHVIDLATEYKTEVLDYFCRAYK